MCPEPLVAVSSTLVSCVFPDVSGADDLAVPTLSNTRCPAGLVTGPSVAVLEPVCPLLLAFVPPAATEATPEYEAEPPPKFVALLVVTVMLAV
jgi:hypothetical protein